MSQNEFKIKRHIIFRENIVAEVPFLQEVRENDTSDVESVDSKINLELPDTKNRVLFKRRIKLNENVIGEVPVISPKRSIPNLTIPENINEITEEPEVKSPEIEFDEIYDSLTDATIDIENDTIENVNIEDDKIDPAVEVKFEEILQLYESKQRPISLDTFNSTKQSKIPIFRQLSETGTRILSRAPRRRSLDNKEFKDTAQSKIKTFEQFENKIEDTLLVTDDNKDEIVRYECVKVENNEDEHLDAVENIKESVELKEQSDLNEKLRDRRRPVLAKFLNKLKRNKTNKTISAHDNIIEKQDNIDLRRKGKSGIPLLKKISVSENTNNIDAEINQNSSPVNQDSLLETNIYENNTETIAKEDHSETLKEFIVEDAISNEINSINTKPIVVQEQVKEQQADVGTLTNVGGIKKEFVESNQSTNYVKPQTEYQKYIENKKYQEQMGFKPVSSKIAIFEDRNKLAPKFQKTSKTESNQEPNVEIRHTTTPVQINGKHKYNNKTHHKDFQINANNIEKDDKTHEIIEKELFDGKINEAHKNNITKAEDDHTQIYETHNVNVEFNVTRQESISLDLMQKELNDTKEMRTEKPKRNITKLDKDIIKRPLAVFASKQTEEMPTLKRAKSVADIELGTKIKGKVELAIKELFVDKVFDKPVGIMMKERPRRNSVSEKIALFEKKITPVPMDDQLLNVEDKLKMAPATTRMIGLNDTTEPDIFVISKLWNTYHAPALVERACRESLETLGLEYVDLYLIHQPMSFKEGSNPTPMVNNSIQYSEQHDFVDAWKAMMELKRQKLVKSIGVSNFNVQQLQTLINETGETPAVNQIECHPYLTQGKLSEFCAKNHIAVSAYSVLGSKGTPAEYKSRNASAVVDDPAVRQLAKRSGLSPTQILLRYQLERGHCLVVKSSTPEHLLMNLSCLNMKLSKEQVGLLNELNRDQRNFDFKGMGDTHKNYPFHAFE